MIAALLLILSIGFPVAVSAQAAQSVGSGQAPPSTQQAGQQPSDSMPGGSSESVIPYAPAAAGYRIVTRSDFSARVDGNYIGHLYDETRSLLTESGGPGQFTGDQYQFEETLRDLIAAAHRIDTTTAATVSLDPGPIYIAHPDNHARPVVLPTEEAPAASPYLLPSPFPALPTHMPSVGSTWSGVAYLRVDPLHTGTPTTIAVMCNYRFDGTAPYEGKPAFILSGGFTVNYHNPASQPAAAPSEPAPTAGSVSPVDPVQRSDSIPLSASAAISAAAGTHARDTRASIAAFVSAPDPKGDPNLSAVTGQHQFSFAFATDGGGPLFLRDSIDETYEYSSPEEVDAHFTRLASVIPPLRTAAPIEPVKPFAPTLPFAPQIAGDRNDGAAIGKQAAVPGSSAGSRTEVRYQGFALTWFLRTTPLEDNSVVASAVKSLPPSENPDVQVSTVPEGVRITVENVHFLPDRADVVPEDVPRLRKVAAVLATVPDRTFRVVGFTADVGSEKSQYDLSVARAKAIVDYLGQQGIPASRFIYEGKGGADPIGDNSTEAGREKNRRVEITILNG